MLKKIKYLVFLGVIMVLHSCFFKTSDKEISSSVRVKLVYKLDNKQSLYWYNDGSLLTSEGISYFQIADNICDLDFKKANAECGIPLGILKQQNDSVFIVSQDRIIQKKKNVYYKIAQTDYDFKSRASITTADYHKAFFLRDTCKNKK